jgi:hypothetical protein
VASELVALADWRLKKSKPSIVWNDIGAIPLGPYHIVAWTIDLSKRRSKSFAKTNMMVNRIAARTDKGKCCKEDKRRF